MRSVFLGLIFSVVTNLNAQDSLKVLFLGNSYTGYNGLAQIVADLSDAADKVLYYDFNVPGGNTIDDHASNPTSLSKIQQGDWDFVVLQEQSQIPTIPYYRDNLFFPGVNRIKDSISKYNPCAQVVMFMTWGRQNGGQQCDGTGTYCSPVFTDFTHMQDSLENAYLEAAQQIDAIAAPVGIAWKNVLSDTNLVLHMPDQSHPDYSGSYLAACTFFEVFWDTSVVANTFAGTLSNGLSNYLQQQAHAAVHQPGAPWNLDANPCPSTATIASFKVKEPIEVYPNPAVNQLILSLPFSEKASYSILSLSGQVISFGNVSEQKSFIPVDHLESGSYLLKVKISGGVEFIRFIKQ